MHIGFLKWQQDGGVAPRNVISVEVPINQMNDSPRSGATDAVIAAAPVCGQILAAKTGARARSTRTGDLAAEVTPAEMDVLADHYEWWRK